MNADYRAKEVGMPPDNLRSGYIMPAAIMLLVIVSLLGASAFFLARQSLTACRKWELSDRCLLAAQSALEKVKYDIQGEFEEVYEKDYSWTNISWVPANAPRVENDLHLDPYPDIEVDVTILSGNVIGSNETQTVILTNEAQAVFEGTKRRIREVVRYAVSRSTVFDYAYFINNYGWFYGVHAIMNGDIRSNRDMELKSRNLVLNGDAYASGNNNVKRPYDSWSWYEYYYGLSDRDRARPVSHTDFDENNPDTYWPTGYDGSVDINDDARDVKMPYLGNLLDYKNYAQSEDGTIRNSSGILVSNVYGDDADELGPSGVAGAPDDGSIILEGTPEDPLIVDGPVVVEGDVIIKGNYTGKGAIYSGRNVHLIDDLTALDPPSWPKPDYTPSNTVANNADKDFLGLCAKGSTILGDYQGYYWEHMFSYYITPPFTEPYPVSMTDSNIGYVSYSQNGTNYFDGDYTQVFGEKVATDNPSNTVSRKLYESSISDGVFASLNPVEYIAQVDAVLYDNHLSAGYFASGAQLNGGTVCRDECFYLGGTVSWNWDSRLGSESPDGLQFNMYMPKMLAPMKTIIWMEMVPE